MATPLTFRPDDELQEAIEAERDRVEEQSGYRPNRSKVVRRKLRQQYGLVDDVDQKGAA